MKTDQVFSKTPYSYIKTLGILCCTEHIPQRATGSPKQVITRNAVIAFDISAQLTVHPDEEDNLYCDNLFINVCRFISLTAQERCSH